MSSNSEQIVKILSTHWVKYARPLSMYIILTGACFLLFMLAGELAEGTPIALHGVLFTAMIMLYLVNHWFFHKLLSEAMEDIIITNQRVIWLKESLFIQDDMRQIPLNRIRGVEAHKRGIRQTVLHYGTIWFDTGGTGSQDINATIEFVPHPNDIARLINHNITPE